MKIFLVTLVAFFMLGSLVWAQNYNYVDMKKQIVSCLDDVLVDPDSAKIKFGPYIPSKKSPGAGLLCAKVNSKNKMGGFTGYQIGYFFFENGKITPCSRNTFDPALANVIYGCTQAEYN